MAKPKPKFKVGDHCIVTATERVFVGQSVKGADELGHIVRPVAKYGAAFYEVLEVSTLWDDIRYTVAPRISKKYYDEIRRKPYDDYRWYLEKFYPYAEYSWKVSVEVYESGLRRYLKADMDIEYVVLYNGDVQYEGLSRKKAMSFKAQTPWVDITITETDRNTDRLINVWTNQEAA